MLLTLIQGHWLQLLNISFSLFDNGFMVILDDDTLRAFVDAATLKIVGQLTVDS